MGQRLGSLIGAIGGVLFVLLNAGDLGRSVGVVVRVVGVVVFVVVLFYAVVRTRGRSDLAPRPPRSALRTYWVCVVAEVVAFPVGALVLGRVLHQPQLTPVWVVFVVGVHFLPFARAFHVSLFGYLSAALIVVAVVGAVLALLVDPVAVPWAAVAAGFVLLAFAAVGALRASAPASGRPSAR